MNTTLNSWNKLLLFTAFSAFPLFIFGQVDDEIELDEDEESEFAEPIFFDTSTDIGGEPKELEINYVASFDIDNGINYLSTGFEFEYVIFKNFGIELEPQFTTFFTDNGAVTGLNDWELETQYTYKATDKLGIAGGIEFGLPIGDRNLQLSEGTFEIEPFITTVHKTEFGLSIHPRVSVGIGVFELEDDSAVEEPEEEEGLEYIGSLALLYTHENLFVGTEISGIYEDEFTTIFTPQFGLTVNHLFLGAGFQVSLTEEGTGYGVISRIIYELEFGD